MKIALYITASQLSCLWYISKYIDEIYYKFNLSPYVCSCLLPSDNDKCDIHCDKRRLPKFHFDAFRTYIDLMNYFYPNDEDVLVADSFVSNYFTLEQVALSKKLLDRLINDINIPESDAQCQKDVLDIIVPIIESQFNHIKVFAPKYLSTLFCNVTYRYNCEYDPFNYRGMKLVSVRGMLHDGFLSELVLTIRSENYDEAMNIIKALSEKYPTYYNNIKFEINDRDMTFIPE